ncbi:MAG: hypothetical protein E7643_04875 [Ruminococcaceae bacterium]|nr:hypothetical protein [Oscillospiraceae bacterium]
MPKNRVLGYGARERSRIILYTVIIGIMILVLSSLQVSLFGRFRPFGAVPDLMLCLVLCIAFFQGRYTGAITGIAAGFVIEAIGSVGLSLLPVAYMIYGYVVGHYAHAMHTARYPSYLLYLVCGLFLRAALTVAYACLSYRIIHLPDIITYSVLPELFGTAIAGMILYFPMKPLCALLDGGKRR